MSGRWPRHRAPALLRAGAALGPLLLGGCAGSSFGAPESAALQGRDVVALWRIFFLAAVAVGVLVLALILWSAVRYRRRSDELPRQFHENVPIEVVYTALPVLLVAVLFALTARTQARVLALDPDPDLVVRVTAFQWQWRFDYPAEGVTVVGESRRAPEVMLPVGETVRVELTSADVVHAFYVPEFLSKRDAVPGRVTRFDVTVTRTGSWESGRCAEFCGLFHDRMTFSVRGVGRAEFDAWLAETRRSAP